jgi:hypothetical protein
MVTEEELKHRLEYNPWNGVFRWKNPHSNRLKVGDIAGSAHGEHWRIVIGSDKYYAHHLAWFWVYGEWVKGIDHRDRDGQNNAIWNLRRAGQSLNTRNSRVRRSNTSGYTGVTWRENRSTWEAKIRVDGKLIRIGSFKQKEDAIRARRRAEKLYNNGTGQSGPLP